MDVLPYSEVLSTMGHCKETKKEKQEWDMLLIA